MSDDTTPPLGPEATRALARLQAPDSPALFALARMVVDETTATPIAELASPRWLASQLQTVLEALTRGDTLKLAVQARLDKGRDTWASDERPLRQVVPEEVVPPLEKLLGRPYTPSEGLMRRIMRQPAVRDLISRVLDDTLHRFGRRMRALDDGAGGLGQRAARRGRRLGKGLLAAAGVADVAHDLARTLSEEVEHAIEGRVKGFIGEATTRAAETMVSEASDPATAESFAAFRVALLHEILDTPIAELMAEAEGLGPMDAIDVLQEAIRAELDRTDAGDDGEPARTFTDRAEARIRAALDEAGDGTLGAWLDEVELREVWVDTTTELVAARLQAVVETDDFVAWWAALFAE